MRYQEWCVHREGLGFLMQAGHHYSQAEGDTLLYGSSPLTKDKTRAESSWNWDAAAHMAKTYLALHRQVAIKVKYLFRGPAILKFQALLGSLWHQNSHSTSALTVGICKGRQSHHSWFITVPEAPRDFQWKPDSEPICTTDILSNNCLLDFYKMNVLIKSLCYLKMLNDKPVYWVKNH